MFKTYDDDNPHSCWGNDGWVDHHCMTKCRQFPRTAARRFWDNSKTKKKAFQKNRILLNNFFSRIKNLQQWFWCIVCGGVVSEEGRQVALLPFIYQPVVSWRHLYSIHSYLIEHGLLCRTPYMSYNIKISSINWPFYGSAPWNNVGGRRCSDNFEATKCAHSWSFLPILFREHIEMETRLRKHLKHLPQSVRW